MRSLVIYTQSLSIYYNGSIKDNNVILASNFYLYWKLVSIHTLFALEKRIILVRLYCTTRNRLSCNNLWNSWVILVTGQLWSASVPQFLVICYLDKKLDFHVNFAIYLCATLYPSHQLVSSLKQLQCPSSTIFSCERVTNTILQVR